jgi:glycosyltransferase involved in cell wall biosynthesis
MARFHDVTVITRANNSEAIERGLAAYPGPHPRFLYFDLPDSLLAAKRRGMPVALYYTLWQLGARWHVRRQLPDFDIVHHVTFNSLLAPGFWWFTGRRVVVGPLGGGMICPWELIGEFGEQWVQEIARSLLVLSSPVHPLVMLGCGFASRILAANEDTARRIPGPFRKRVRRMLETGIDPEKYPRSAPLEIETRVVWAGSLIKRKGGALALRAFARARASLPDLRLLMIGTGPEEENLRALAADMDIEKCVEWRGRVPHDSMPEVLREQSVFLFTSIRDTSGNVLLEAMASGLPAVIISHHGVAEIATDATAIRVPPDKPGVVIDGLAAGLVRLAQSRELRMELGANARARIASEYAWDRKGEAMNAMYEEVMAL